MPLDLTGIAAIIIAIGTPLTVVFGQYNTRKAVQEAREEAKLAEAVAAKERVRVAEEQKAAMDAQNQTLSVVKDNTDGALTAAKKVADAFEAEAERLRKGGGPTPAGEPGPDQPVAMQWKATVERPERPDADHPATDHPETEKP